MIQSKIKECLLRIEKCSSPEAEALLSVVSESSPSQIHVGASCANARNQVFTVIGFSDTEYTQAKNKPQDLRFSLDFDPGSKRKIAYGLYYDPNNPERQEIIDCKVRECKYVRDLNDAMLLTAAKNSPFFDAGVVQHFMKILKGDVKSEEESM